MKVLLAFLGLIMSANVFAQSLEDDINVIYMKADVLMQSERYDEAIRVYNQIIRDQPDFKYALMQRAKAKYFLGAYKGTRKDLLQHIDLKGINKKVIHWMAKTEYEMKNYMQSKTYLDVAIEMDVYDADLYLHRARVNVALNNQNLACEDWSQAAQLGSSVARSKLGEECLNWESDRPSTTTNDRREEEPSMEERNEGGPITKVPDYQRGSETDTEKDTNTDTPNVPAEDLDSYQEFDIDEDLTVVVGNGLGKRKVESIPDIFLLSDNSGRVVINICVDESGRVSEATFDNDLSTIYKTNINSLAIRKSKDFVFLPSFKDEQCGTITFLIAN